MDDCLRAVKLSHYVTSYPGLLSLPSLRGQQMSTSYILEGKAGIAHPIADERVGMQVKLRIDPLRTRAILERF